MGAIVANISNDWVRQASGSAIGVRRTPPLTRSVRVSTTSRTVSSGRRQASSRDAENGHRPGPRYVDGVAMELHGVMTIEQDGRSRSFSLRGCRDGSRVDQDRFPSDTCSRGDVRNNTVSEQAMCHLAYGLGRRCGWPEPRPGRRWRRSGWRGWRCRCGLSPQHWEMRPWCRRRPDSPRCPG